jgi:hypothetical protein
MKLVAKILAGALLFAGVCWSFATFGDLAPGVPPWSRWLGPAAIVVGLPLLFIFGARHGQEKFDAGEWIEVEGTVDRIVHRGAEFSSHHYMRVSFTAPTHGKFKYDESISTERAHEFVKQSKGKPVVADVRSNDRRWLNVKTVDGKSWLLLNSERARTASRSSGGTRQSG